MSNKRLFKPNSHVDKFCRLANVDSNPANFQPLHKTVNIAKRDHCKECVLTGIRFDARYLGYSVAQWIGDNVYRGSCIGCYWYSPYIFNQEVSKGYKRSK